MTKTHTDRTDPFDAADPFDRPELRAAVVDLAEAAYTGRVSRWNEVRTSAHVDPLELEFGVCLLLGRLLAERAGRRGTPAVDAWASARSSVA